MFEVRAKDKSTKARSGRLTTGHGVIETPAFMPVGTQGSVKAVSSRELRELNTQIVLGNTYHLFVRPGLDVIRHFGGLHGFMNWDGPILTDSGGYQIFSLAKLRKITEEGAHFQNHVDGTPAFISPEIAMQIQTALGSDIAMVLDECLPWPCEYDYAARSAELTARWAQRCKRAVEAGVSPANLNNAAGAAATTANPLLFGIVQGATFPELRKQSAQVLVEIGFDGYAIGGVSVGEPEEEMRYASAVARADRARNGYVRLRVADPAGAQWDRVREFWHAQSEERRVRARQKSNRARLRLPGLPGVHARLHPSSYQS